MKNQSYMSALSRCLMRRTQRGLYLGFVQKYWSMPRRIIMILSGALMSVYAVSTNGQVGIVLPNNQQSFNHDEIRTSSGLSCRQAAGSSTNVEFGVVGSDEQFDRSSFDPTGESGTLNQRAAVYARITHSFGAPKRLDCSRVYDLEVERLKAEIELLRLEQQYSMGQD